jgi:hypothetical protein
METRTVIFEASDLSEDGTLGMFAFSGAAGPLVLQVPSSQLTSLGIAALQQGNRSTRQTSPGQPMERVFQVQQWKAAATPSGEVVVGFSLAEAGWLHFALSPDATRWLGQALQSHVPQVSSSDPTLQSH